MLLVEVGSVEGGLCGEENYSGEDKSFMCRGVGGVFFSEALSRCKYIRDAKLV
jgi:hypothetical protein